ncbi:MAG: PSD1 and planctomycete cytochrome C domain-containing protein [Planctomycetota bacterium]|nr:PSD1 and planctomycete cytochrome C domain-containing protein [Planctomycetota bacterium]
MPKKFYVAFLVGLTTSWTWADVDETVDFSREIRTILSAKCFACHGADDETREAELRLDRRDDAIAARDGEAAIVPGDAQTSELYRRITTDDPERRMPPPDSGHELTKEQIALLGRWIDQGAEYAQHWSFIKPMRPELPNVQNAELIKNPIDAFILAKLNEHQLGFAPEADRYALIRRLSLDLTGLPPTPEEADAFVRDDSPEAYERLVDRLLESQRYGEHWARMWLDLARYADTKGYEKDQPREIWRYRDWVIAALNADMPYDRFTLEQLAGDLLPDATPQQQLATAFHRNTMTNDEGGTDNEEFRVLAVKDRVDTTMQVWMGLTIGCAKCHSHKYDPITMREYYQFFAFFNQTEDADRPDDAPRIEAPTAEQSVARVALLSKLEALRKEPEAAERITTVEAELAGLTGQIQKTPVMRELAEDRRRQTFIHVRGNFLEPGDKVELGVPEAFGPLPEGVPRNRLGVAQWLTHPDNPLTPRVAVNRVWARIFGLGIVETEEDFGSQGVAPSHPELLDWLAVEFRDSLGWSMKQLCKTIVMSTTYRQSSQIDSAKQEADPRNQLLSRSPRFRLSAEAVRDQALAVSGLLSPKMFGPSVMPPQPAGIWQTTYSQLRWITSAGEDRYRRGLYTFLRRTSPYPSLLMFDAGSREICQIRRVRTNTPLQALVTLNDPVYVEAAGGLAVRILKEQNLADTTSRASRSFRIVLVRPPTQQETDRLVSLYESAWADFQADPAAVESLLESSNVAVAENPNKAELAAWIVVGNVLLNLDETLMRN